MAQCERRGAVASSLNTDANDAAERPLLGGLCDLGRKSNPRLLSVVLNVLTQASSFRSSHPSVRSLLFDDMLRTVVRLFAWAAMSITWNSPPIPRCVHQGCCDENVCIAVLAG